MLRDKYIIVVDC